jgi:hypothetical protein
MQYTYKIQEKTSKHFWTGYGLTLSETSGCQFANKAAAVRSLHHAIRYQQRYKAVGNNNRISLNSYSNWEIVEYLIIVKENSTVPAVDAVFEYAFLCSMDNRHGGGFAARYAAATKDQTIDIKYAVSVLKTNFIDLREDLKGLGYSSRHYKKTGNWLWISDPEVMLRMQLLPYISLAINIDDAREQFRIKFNEM